METSSDNGTEKPCSIDLTDLVKKGESEKVISILKTRPVRLFNSHGNHFLHLAARYNNSEIIKFLIARRCNVNVKNSLGLTPFIVAIVHENFEAAKVLHNALIDSVARQVLVPNYWFSSKRNKREKAINNSYHDLVSQMKKNQMSSEKIGEALAKGTVCSAYNVARFHDSAMTKAFLQSADWIDGNTIYRVFEIVTAKRDFNHLHVILQNPPRMVDNLFGWFGKYLLDNISEIHHSNNSGRQFLKKVFTIEVFNEIQHIERLEVALRRWPLKSVEAFLHYNFHSVIKEKHGLDISANLFGNRKVDAISLLKHDQIDVNGRSYKNKTPLHFAAESNLDKNVLFLLKQDADPNARDDNGRTPLSLAIFKEGFERCVSYLLWNDANPLDINYSTFEESNIFADFTENYLYNCHFTMLMCQLVILEAQGKSIEGYDKLYEIFKKYEPMKFMDECRQQLNEMKAYNIRDTKLTLFMVLTEKSEKLVPNLKVNDVRVIYNLVNRNEKTCTTYYRYLLHYRARRLEKLLTQTDSRQLPSMTKVKFGKLMKRCVLAVSKK